VVGAGKCEGWTLHVVRVIVLSGGGHPDLCGRLRLASTSRNSRTACPTTRPLLDHGGAAEELEDGSARSCREAGTGTDEKLVVSFKEAASVDAA
jgi:hypothetical protein